MSVLEPGLMGFYQPLPEVPEEKDKYEQDFDDLIDRYARKMGFSKKHFEAFARQINALHQAGKHAEGDAIHGMVLSLNDNPRFQPERFKTAAHKGMDLTGKSQYCESCGSGSAKYSLLADPQTSNGRAMYGLNWHTFAGGTFAAEGKHGHAAYTDNGEYHIQPISHSNGRHRGYHLSFANTKGKISGGGLWHDLGMFNHPNKAKSAAMEHNQKLSDSSSTKTE